MFLQLCIVPQTVALKKSNSYAKFVAEVAQKIWKVAPKLHAILHIFRCKILLWPFGTLANFGNEQQKTSLNIV